MSDTHWVLIEAYHLTILFICCVILIINFQGARAPPDRVKKGAPASHQAGHRTAIVNQVFRVQRVPLEAVRVTSSPPTTP